MPGRRCGKAGEAQPSPVIKADRKAAWGWARHEVRDMVATRRYSRKTDRRSRDRTQTTAIRPDAPSSPPQPRPRSLPVGWSIAGRRGAWASVQRRAVWAGLDHTACKPREPFLFGDAGGVACVPGQRRPRHASIIPAMSRPGDWAGLRLRSRPYIRARSGRRCSPQPLRCRNPDQRRRGEGNQDAPSTRAREVQQR